MAAYLSHGEYIETGEETDVDGNARHYLDMPSHPEFKLALTAAEKELIQEFETGEVGLEPAYTHIRMGLHSLNR